MTRSLTLPEYGDNETSSHCKVIVTFVKSNGRVSAYGAFGFCHEWDENDV